MSYSLLYLEHLSDQDLEVMAHASGPGSDVSAVRIRLSAAPDAIDEMLARPEIFDLVFGGDDESLAPRVTPFFAFGLLVHRLAADLNESGYVYEWTGPRRRLPIFDVDSLREFLEAGARRYFLVELLASFTKVASGTTWVKTRRGYRRRRFSELDPVNLAEAVDRLPVAHRPAGYRRLGDVALFLSGVLPDHTAARPLPPAQRERLVRSAGVAPGVALIEDDLVFHEALGAAWYRKAVETATELVGRGPEPVLDVAERFRPARRVLNLLADRYLFHYRPVGGAG